MNQSETLFQEAVTVMPGGVNSPVRAFGSVGTTPRFIKSAKGACLYDEDGNQYMDYIGSWGPMILGHANEAVIDSVTEACRRGLSFGAATAIEVEMAKLVCQLIPSIEMVRMVNSGTEAVMSAIRLARGYTGRNKIIKFTGCYHGHSDSLLVKAGSGVMTSGVPDSLGVPAGCTQDTLSADYNNLDTVTEHFKRCGEEIAQGYFGVTPDLTTFGKIIGGGMPVGAYGGKREIMELVSPVGGVYQAGTLSGNPVAMAAGITQLTILKEHPEYYTELNQRADQFYRSMQEIFEKAGHSWQVNHVGSLGCLYFTEQEVTDYESAKTSDTEAFARYCNYMMEHGVYLAPSQFEAMFLSLAHTEELLNDTLKIMEQYVR